MHIVVAGAGSIGCFAGGLLAAGGRDVTLLGRAHIVATVAEHGLTLTDYAGLERRARPAVSVDPAVLAGAGLVLVTVKSGATAEMARLIARHAPPAAPVVSLQNGLQGAETLRRMLPGRDVRAGMVPFNVVPQKAGRFHRSTSGEVVIAGGPGGIAARLTVPGLTVVESADITAVQWGKLLMNLANAVNALSGLTLQEQLLDIRWRRVIAAQFSEALGILRACGISVRPPTPGPVALVPHVLRLPTPLFRRVAARMLTVDPKARTSMAYDLMAGRRTEIDMLQGEIVARAVAAGRAAPINAHVRTLVQAAEAAQAGLPGLRPDAFVP